ncbi:hypothetical protein [Alicyclobacillus ferrooxydans]|uniref:hypothetical protein n=1 Tax=Alicyclobacillus ferrooxydans TaxID=471514 RepID=UPI0012EE9C4E|nr:hypothetical protein [Alicyclobacillus ferrooxydans]
MQTTRKDEVISYEFKTTECSPPRLVDKQVNVTATLIERWMVANREVKISDTKRIA